MEKPEAESCGCPPTKGHAHASVFTPPLRELTPETSHGFRVIAFARAMGLRLMPWQRWFFIHALELKEDGTYRFSTIVLTVARQNGKTTLATISVTAWLSVFLRAMVVGVAQNRSIAREVFDSVVSLYESNPLLSGEMAHAPIMTNGLETLVLTEGRRYKPVAAVRGAGRGLSIDALFMDEVREQRDWGAWGALAKATAARWNSTKLLASNAGDRNSVVLNALIESAEEDIKEGTESGIGLFMYTTDMTRELGDVEGHREANPAYGYMPSLAQAILDALSTDPPNVFRTEVLNQKVDRLDAPLDPIAWLDGLDRAKTLFQAARDGKLHVSLDMSADGLRTTLAAATIEGESVRVGVIKSWVGVGHARNVLRDLPDLLTKLKPRTLSYNKSGPAGAYKVPLGKLRGLTVISVEGTDVTSACSALAQLVSGRQVFHNGDPLLNAQVLGAGRLVVGDAWRFHRRAPDASDVESLYAVAFAAQAARAAVGGAMKFITVDDDDEEQLDGTEF